MKKSKTRKLLETQTYSIVINHYDDNTSEMTRACDGFSPLELLGLCEHVSKDVREQMSGIIKPTLVKRIVVTD